MTNQTDQTVTGGKRGHDERWAFLAGMDIGADGDPYLDRLKLIQTPWFGLYLHHIHRADIERDPHDHPWAFASLVLCGRYDEAVWPDKTQPAEIRFRVRRRGSLRCVRLRSSHIITRVDGILWTLVLTGPKRGSWGFWRDGEFTPWRDYQFADDTDEMRGSWPDDH